MPTTREFVFLLILIGEVASSWAAKPNIVLLFADDTTYTEQSRPQMQNELGYGDLSTYGHPTSYTPNIHRLADEGLVFTQFYSSAPVCSPSRAALLTGRHHVRAGIYPGVFFPDDIGGLPLEETTIAEVLKPQGYSTGMVGKWHLGVGENKMYLPTNQGFDYYFGIPYSTDMCPCLLCFYPDQPCVTKCNEQYVGCPLLENNDIIQQPVDYTTLSAYYANAAISFIRAKAATGDPFFLYMAFSHTHRPQYSSQQFTNSSIRGHFGDSLTELDWEVGQIMDAIRDAKIDTNTFVFFTSDNGPSLVEESEGGNAGLLRCGKSTTWEGGVRMPAIAWWPGKIQSGRTFELAATVDILPTLAQISGASLPPVTLDGLDMSPILFSSTTSNRDFYPYYQSFESPQGHTSYAFRYKGYKAHFFIQGGLCSDTYPDEMCRSSTHVEQPTPPLLYNLNTDPSEQYGLDPTENMDIIKKITMMRELYDSTMVWGTSQISRGKNSSYQLCGSPGCTNFPSCCRINILKRNTSRVVS